jgi:aspartate ammonia-lyase
MLKELRLVRDFSDSAQNPDDLAHLAHVIDGVARCLVKQAADLRLLSSGPEYGLMEISLPAVQPGSSAMPGKINPVLPEFLIQSCFTAIGLVTSTGLACEHGELDLNVWDGVFLHSICTAIRLVTQALNKHTVHCLKHLAIDKRRSQTRSKGTTSVITMQARASTYSEALALLRAGKG